jgi:hypothetical protein
MKMSADLCGNDALGLFLANQIFIQVIFQLCGLKIKMIEKILFMGKGYPFNLGLACFIHSLTFEYKPFYQKVKSTISLQDCFFLVGVRPSACETSSLSGSRKTFSLRKFSKKLKSFTQAEACGYKKAKK